jgi:HEAT repeat protein
MKNRQFLWLGGGLLVAVAALFILPATRYGILQFVSSEGYYDSRPVSYWARNLKSEDPQERSQAAFILGHIGPEAKETVPALAALLKDKEGIVRVNAALALFKLGSDAREAVPELTDALKDEVPLVRMDATLALFKLGEHSKSAIPALLAAMREERNRPVIVVFHKSIRQQALAAIGRVGAGAQEVVPDIVAVLQDKEEGMRRSAASALKDIGPSARAAVPQLLLALKDPSEEVRTDVAAALKTIDPDAATKAGVN